MRLALALLTLLAAPAAADMSHMSEPLIFGTHGFRSYEHGGPVQLYRREWGVTFRRVDANRNGVWDPHEIRTAFGRAARDVVMSFDADADGSITVTELRSYNDGGSGGPDGVLWERPAD